MITVWANELARAPTSAIRPRTAAWYDKRKPTFSDAIAAVRRVLWRPQSLSTSRPDTGTIKIPVAFPQRLTTPSAMQPEMRKVELKLFQSADWPWQHGCAAITGYVSSLDLVVPRGTTFLSSVAVPVYS